MQKRTIQILSIALFASLFTWGFWSLLSYVGSPSHISIIASDAAQKAADARCTGGSIFCKGFTAFFPALAFSVQRMSPLLWYAVVSAVLYALFVGWTLFQRGGPTLRLRFRPFSWLLLFLGSVWLIFMVLSYQEVDGQPLRRLYEPLPNVYVNVGEESLQQLKENFEDLQDRGCLQPAPGTNDIGYDIRPLCIQQAFLTRVISQMLVAIVFLFELLILGRAMLSFLRLKPRSFFLESLFSAGLGALGWVALLWTVAVAGFFTPNVGWFLVVLMPVVCLRHSIYFLEKFISHRWEVRLKPYDLSILLAWLLLSYLALNFLTVIRPFPIGWDDLGRYLNHPRLLVSYGHFIHSMSPFQWEYLTALGFLLFGYTQPFGATAAMIINWTEGLFAVLAVFGFTRFFLGRGGVLSALLYYSLPLVGHFSFADMKIDNAVFTIGALATFAVFLFLFPESEEDVGPRTWDLADSPVPSPKSQVSSPSSLAWLPDGWQWLVVAGLLSGFAFAIKPTAVMVILPLIAILLGVLIHWSAFLGGALMTVALFIANGALNISDTLRRIYGDTSLISGGTFLFVSLLLGAGLIGLAVFLRGGMGIRKVGCALLLFVAGMAVSVSPWLLHNNILAGHLIPRLELGAPDVIRPTMALRGREVVEDVGQPIRELPPDLALNPDHPSCKGTANVEELDRYWGFRQGWIHYATLPWRTVMNLDSGGYYVMTSPSLLLFPLLLLLPAFWMRRGRWLRWLWAGTLFILIEWMFLAGGVPWYGVGVFLGLVIALEALVVLSPDRQSRILSGTLIALSLVFLFCLRFWQFEQQRNLVEYPLGKVSAGVLMERTIPWYDDITEIVLERHHAMPDRPYLYRVGTFIPYFVPKNLEVIGIGDNQLDFFHCLYQERNPALTLRRLQVLGFNSIIFDTNTHTIERDANGSLHQKVNAFVDFINDPSLKLNILVNDTGAGVAFILLP